MGLASQTEALLTRVLERGNTAQPGVISNVYDRAAGVQADMALLRLRAASFSPQLLADGIQGLVSPPTGEVSCLDVGCNIGAKTDFIIQNL